MSAQYLVIGQFKYVDDTKTAISCLKAKGVRDFRLYSPVPNHELEEEIYKGKRRSSVRMFTLLGGITGCLGAFLMTIWMSLDWPLRTSAKPVIAIPSFVVIGFECTVLLGCIFTLIGMLHFSRIPNIFRCPGYRPDFTKNLFGLVARVSKEDADSIKGEFEKCGAAFVEVEYVR